MRKGNAGAIPKARLTNKDLYDRAKDCVLNDKRPTLTHLQRCLNIGYNKASELMDRMVVEGLVSAPDKNGVRHICGIQERQLIKTAGFSGFLDFENYMQQRFKMWRVRTLFGIAAAVSIDYTEFCINVAGCSIGANISIMRVLRCLRVFYILRRHRLWYKKLGKHKRFEVALYCDGALTTGFTFYKHIHCDHTPCRLEVALLGITLGIEYYDSRHWNNDTGTYEIYDGGVLCDKN